MNEHWRYDECSVAFYHEGIETGMYKVVDALNAAESRIAELEAAGAKLADATQDLINALPLEFSNWEIVPVHKALLDWNEISKEREE